MYEHAVTVSRVITLYDSAKLSSVFFDLIGVFCLLMSKLLVLGRGLFCNIIKTLIQVSIIFSGKILKFVHAQFYFSRLVFDSF